jgi:hypothetical protein
VVASHSILGLKISNCSARIETPSGVVEDFSFFELLDPENEGTTLLRNYLPVDMA